jgi:Kef-type K+ transport system membrane component KefB
MSSFEVSVLFFLQLAVILGVCRAVGWVAKYFGQPQVVAEMIAGVLMGPSLLGYLSPELQAWLFPAESKTGIYIVSQVGLVLYMFLIGLEFDTGLIANRLRSAVAVSVAGIAAPFVLGAILSYSLTADATFFTAGVSPIEAMLFTGASMSITAFPMLARIIYERGLSGTSLGTLALSAGSSDDAAAWCILAVVLASFSGDSSIAVLAIGGGLLYAVLTLTVGRKLLKPLGDWAERTRGVNDANFTLMLIALMLGAWFTDRIGIYAVFGAFIMGIAMPRGLFAKEVQKKLEPLTVNFLLPLFFIYSGLNTSLGLVSTPYLWMIMFLVLLAACLGKGVACWAAARLCGEPNRDAVAIGTLMNARGLMELILLNIGLERGVITPTFFTIMVLMAVVTTLMATPIFEWVYRTPASVGSPLRGNEATVKM